MIGIAKLELTENKKTMSTKTKHDRNNFIKLTLVTISLATLLVLTMLYINNPNIVTGISALVGVAIPLFWANSSDTLKENKGIEGYVRWCDVITNSNLTTINNDLSPWLKYITFCKKGMDSNIDFSIFGDIELFHDIMRKNLDVKAYIEFLNSGLYYKLESGFQNTLFFLVETITKAEIIYSIQAFKIKKYREDPSILQKESLLRQDPNEESLVGDPIDVLLNDLNDRLNEIKTHLEKLKTYILQYKKEFWLPNDN